MVLNNYYKLLTNAISGIAYSASLTSEELKEIRPLDYNGSLSVMNEGSYTLVAKNISVGTYNIYDGGIALSSDNSPVDFYDVNIPVLQYTDGSYAQASDISSTLVRVVPITKNGNDFTYDHVLTFVNKHASKTMVVRKWGIVKNRMLVAEGLLDTELLVEPSESVTVTFTVTFAPAKPAN